MDLTEQLERRWQEESHCRPIRRVMSLEAAGLVLGVGTVLVPCDRERHEDLDLDRDAARILTLLSVAYNRSVPLSVLANIRRASGEWKKGEDCLAAIHLAFTGLSKLDPPREAARRVFIADALLTQGIAPRTILKALGIDEAALDRLEKYSSDEPRIPAGNGVESGRWTAGTQSDDHSFLAKLPKSSLPGLAGFLERQTELETIVRPQISTVGVLARAGSAFGLWLIPSRAGGRDHSGEIPGAPGFSYSWTDDETDLRIIHSDGTGKAVVLHAQLADGVFYDRQGRGVAHLVGHQVIVDTAMLPEDARNAVNDNNEPRLCPVPVLDRPGRDVGGRETDKSRKDRAYEDYLKQLINPGNPTPHGMGYAFRNPVRNGTVIVDDCKKTIGDLHEIKGTNCARLIEKFRDKKEFWVRKQWIDQAEREVEAAPNREIIWDFAEKETRDYARELFDDYRYPELHRIRTVWVPWIRSVK